MGKTHIQRKLEKIQQHGIEYRVFDLEGNIGQETRRFRFEEDVYRALLNNPAVAGEVIVLTQTALQHKNKAQQELFQVLLKKIFAKDALHTSAQAEFELYYESDFFRKLSHETLERYANMHFLPKYALGERSGYVEYIINAIIEHVKEREHEVW